MKKQILFVILSAALVAGGCKAVDEASLTEPAQTAAAKTLNGFVPDSGLLPYVSIKVNEDFAAELEKATGEDGYVTLAKVKSVPGDGILSMRRLFRNGGKFEERMRRYGLHLWYKVEYDEDCSITKAGSGLNIPGVEIIEYNPRIHIVGDPVVTSVVDPASEPSRMAAAATPTATAPFNDPMLSDQWHYYNDGRAASSVSGCDVNVYPVWKSYKTGNADIVVGVVDMGVDFNHEDLADNMWINPEKQGNNRFGYNFATGSYSINPGDHGTHVAGTIAAVNNNGKGVCGIAGGNARKKESGVKIMSCQIFDGQKQGSGAEAIVWSCNNGAIISQNSWGSTVPGTTSAVLKAAVDYFTDNAGFDEKGNQVGPMAGGLVVFAAGNDNSTEPYGSDYSRMYIVASVGADYKRAYYSNYGDWVHISAPGGDVRKGNQIMSTLPDNKYGKMQGTSMACPHVSGVAALILANRMAKGFKNSDLRNLMNKSAVSLTPFNRGISMGIGLVNAYGSIAGSGGKAPERPTNLTAASQSNNVTCSVTIPKDEDDGTPNAIYVYYSTSDFTKTDGLAFAMFYVGDDAKVGQTLTGTITGLEFNTEYYMAAQAADLAGNRSGITSRIRVTTGENSAPVITTLNTESVIIKPHEKASMDFKITEPDGHFCLFELKQGSKGTVLDTLSKEYPKILVTGADAPSGSYKDTLVVTDIYGLSAQKIVSYTILENHKPYAGKTFEDVTFASKTDPTLVLDATEYFKDDDGEELSYAITLSNTTVCNMTYAAGKFHITPMNFGSAEIDVVATDVRGEKVEQSLRVLIRDGSRTADFYPNPVSDVLNVRTGVKGEWGLKLVSPTGAVFYENTVTIGPFDPVQIDMSEASPGLYTAILSGDGKQEKFNVVKI